MESSTKIKQICLNYLEKIRGLAFSHGLGVWWEDTVKATSNPNCKPTEDEVKLLSRIADDERLKRADIPIVLGKSYRQCNEDGDFDKIEKLRHLGIYSKVSTLMASEKKNAF